MVADAAERDARRGATLEEIRSRIIGFLLKHGVPKPDAEDIGNATVVVLLEKTNLPIDPPPISLAIGIAKNKLHEYYRRGPTYPHPPENKVVDDGDGPLEVLIARADREEKIKALEAALEQLGTPCREITRCKMKGMRAIDIAREMKSNVNAVEVQAHRCLGRIRILLAEQKRRPRS